MKRFLCGVLAALMLVVLCACGKQETATVRLSEVTHSVFYAPQYVALEQGFFADEGLNIELTNGGGADKVMTAVLTGQADIGLAGPEACIYVYNQGKDDYPVVFGQLTKRDGSFLVGRADVPFSWELLRGKTVIGGRAGGVPEMTLEYVMRQNGVVPGTDAAVDTTVQFNMMAGAFTGGNGNKAIVTAGVHSSVDELAGLRRGLLSRSLLFQALALLLAGQELLVHVLDLEVGQVAVLDGLAQDLAGVGGVDMEVDDVIVFDADDAVAVGLGEGAHLCGACALVLVDEELGAVAVLDVLHLHQVVGEHVAGGEEVVVLFQGVHLSLIHI